MKNVCRSGAGSCMWKHFKYFLNLFKYFSVLFQRHLTGFLKDLKGETEWHVGRVDETWVFWKTDSMYFIKTHENII